LIVVPVRIKLPSLPVHVCSSIWCIQVDLVKLTTSFQYQDIHTLIQILTFHILRNWCIGRTYTQWTTTGHTSPVANQATDFGNTRQANAPSLSNCHSDAPSYKHQTQIILNAVCVAFRAVMFISISMVHMTAKHSTYNREPK